MGAVRYYITYILIRVITLLPLSILYILSYPLYIILYHITGYRREVARKNLTNSFPDKKTKEIRKIERKFYIHLADLFIETIKSFHMSEREMRRRYVVTNPELPEKILASGRDIAAIGGHFNNWEWLISIPLYIRSKILIIYKPLKNKRYDKLIYKIRSRFGIVLTPMSSIVREIITNRKDGVNTMSVFIADQTPPKPDIRYWTSFLNQDTPIYLGSEKIAKKFDMAVLFFNVRKVKRGYYELTFEELFHETANLPEYAVTEAHVRRLERLIQEAPQYWIWTHRRWKHKKEVSNE